MSGNVLAVPDLDHGDLVRLLPVEIVPVLSGVVADADRLAAQLEAAAIQLCRMDIGLLQRRAVHHSQRPVEDGAL